MTPADFFRSHGLVVEDPRNDARWHRVPTEDKPKKKNGTYRWDGDVAFCTNWSIGSEVHTWHPDDNVRQLTDADRKAFAAKRRAVEETQEKAWERAAEKARALLHLAKPGRHGYAQRKGFPEANVLCLSDGQMFVPMRSLDDGKLVGAQLIQWLGEERVWQKRFIPGMRAKGAIFCIGAPNAKETVLCEGWATGMSIEQAAEALRLNMNVLVTFSAGNMVNVGARMKGRRCFVLADNDASHAGAEAAAKTGFPWAMPPREGEDANDMARSCGVRALSAMLLDLRRHT